MDLFDLLRAYETFRKTGIDLPITNVTVTLKLREKITLRDKEQNDYGRAGEKEDNLQPLVGYTEKQFSFLSLLLQ